MELNNGKKPKPMAFNIVNSGTKHRGFGGGVLDLSNLSSIIIDGEEGYLDEGGLHARSKVEKRIRFSANKEDVPNGRTCWMVWISVDITEHGKYFAGLTACEMLIDSEAGRGWKVLPHHVTMMEKALKRHIILDGMSDAEKQVLKGVLVSHNADWFEQSSEELKQAFQQ